VIFRKAWQIKAVLEHGIMPPDHQEIHTYTRRYYNNLRYGDAATQQVLDLLKKYGLYDNSIIILTSDHGEALGEHREFGHNTSVYEEMVRIPLVIRVPGVEHKTIDQQVGLIDFFPTFVDLLGLEADDVPFQGRSIAPLLLGRDQPSGDYYYSRAFYATKLYFMMRGERFKYIQNDHDAFIFDLREDPDELNNIVDRYPVLAQTLRQRALIMIAANAALRNDLGQEVTLSKEQEEDLRNLGYIQ
jgi:arylsulfatase A-like enzyme